MSLPRHKTSNRGFTLVELLVVISIIAILAVLASAGWTTALRQAQKAKCASNLRQIGIAMLAFSGDNNGNLPTSGDAIAHGAVDNPPPSGSGLPGWTEQIEPYLTKSTDTVASKIYQCPDSSKNPSLKNTMYSYFNGAHAAMAETGVFGPVTLAKMHSPSSHIMAGDIAFNFGFVTNDADKDDYSQDAAFGGGTKTSPKTIPIHGGYSNIIFADGHEESLKFFDPTTMTTVYLGPGAKYDYLYPN